MITRYQNQKIAKLWNETSYANLWWKIELMVAEYHFQKKLITKEILDEIKNTKVDIKRWKEIEQINHHHLASFVDMLSEQTEKGGKWIHFGLTSNDILDTSQNYLLYQSGKIIIHEWKKIINETQKWALQEKNTICVGRTHGMHAEPTTLGYKFLLWNQELQKQLQNFIEANENIKIVKMGGPTGIYAHNDLQLESFIAQKMQMKTGILANQIVPRSYMINWINSLNNLSTIIEKVALQIRLLHQEEIQEIQEGFDQKQKGSSAMPHKKNPYLSENICGLARYLRSTSQGIYSCNLLWHQRDLTNSSIERIVLPDVCHIATTLIVRLQKVLTNLKINYSKINEHLKKKNAIIFSHKLLLFLISKTSLTRDQCYRLLQKWSFEAKKNETTLLQQVLKSEQGKKLNEQEIKKCFDFKDFLINIEKIFMMNETKNIKVKNE